MVDSWSCYDSYVIGPLVEGALARYNSTVIGGMAPALVPGMNTTQTWTDGTNAVTVAYFEAGHVRAENTEREVIVLTDGEWLDRLDNLKDAGWYRSR